MLLLAVGTFVKLRRRPRIGEVSERLKELASKASVGETQPWVRIPPSPPLLSAKNGTYSHFFSSDRLKLQFWDYGDDGKPSLVLVHGGLDHARNWDWVARSLRERDHVYALDLRGHGNSTWAPGAMYSIAEHVLDLSALLDIMTIFHPADWAFAWW